MQILFTNAQEIEKCGLKTDLGRCVYLNKNCIRTMLLTHFSDTRMTLKLSLDGITTCHFLGNIIIIVQMCVEYGSSFDMRLIPHLRKIFYDQNQSFILELSIQSLFVCMELNSYEFMIKWIIKGTFVWDLNEKNVF